MTSPPDKLFRDRLEHFRKPAPPSAWERIESGLDRKRDQGPWMKIAAGLLLLLAASVMLLQRDQTDAGKATTYNNTSSITFGIDTIASLATDKSELNDRETSIVSREDLANGKNVSVENPNAGDASRPLAFNKSQSSTSILNSQFSIKEPVDPHGEALSVSLNAPDEKIDEPSPVTKIETTNETSTHDIVQEQKGTNMTYTADQVNAKFLKQDLPPDATPEKKNASGLQKVIDRALDLRYEESVLADLREKKNEWLSINIPSKQRETNK